MSRNVVIRTNPRTGHVRKFLNGTGEAARQSGGLDPVTISHACLGTHNVGLYGGYRWSYSKGTPRRRGGFTGRKHTPETRRRMSEAKAAKKRPVAAFTKDWQFVASFASLSDAAKTMGDKCVSNIRIAAMGGDSHHGVFHKGYRWAFTKAPVVKTLRKDRQ